MKKQPPSIFNDVIGPVMIGPSSSHTAASARIAKTVRQMIDGKPVEFIAEFHKEGSLAATYHGHGSDIGLIGGLLNYEPSDPDLVTSLEKAKGIGLNVEFRISDYQATHPNTYKMVIKSDLGEKLNVTAISVGGGMFEIIEIDSFEVEIKGDYFETLIFFNNKNEECLQDICNKIISKVGDVEYFSIETNDQNGLISIKTQYLIDDSIIENLSEGDSISRFFTLKPVLPTLSNKDCQVPYLTAEGMLNLAKEKNLELWQAALLYESKRGNISKIEAFDKMQNVVKVMIKSINKGLKGTNYQDRILGPQAYKVKEGIKQDKLIKGEILNNIIGAITAIMEVKSSMGVYVAAPTGGAAGGLPGTIIGTASELGKDINQITRAMLAASMIGVFIAEHATFAGEIGGCQAECGSGSGMAAAGLVQLMGGSIEQAVDAASMALQNLLGMVCDPVGSRVEVPCLGKNILAGTNALASANMSLAGFDKVVPLDETISAMNQVGNMLPVELRCTELAGLSVTNTSKNISERLK